MFGLARDFLVYLLALAIITGCGTGVATRTGGTTNEAAAVNPGTNAPSGETGAKSSSTEAAAKNDGKTQKVTFTADQPDATLLIDGKDKYATPAEVCLTCNIDHSYEISKDGYEKVAGTLNSVRDYKEKSKVPGKAGAFMASLLAAGAMGALAGLAMAAGAPVVPVITPTFKAGHPGYEAGPPRLEPDKVAAELKPESP